MTLAGRAVGAQLARLRAEFAIDRQENMRFCRAEMPSYGVKDLENTQSILCGLFLVCEHFYSGRTASHRTALDFRGIFVLWDAGGLSPAKEKRAKSTEKTGCPTHGFPARRWLIFSDAHVAGENDQNFICACGRKLCEAFLTVCQRRDPCGPRRCVFQFISRYSNSFPCGAWPPGRGRQGGRPPRSRRRASRPPRPSA